jgi:hypothetical protein
LQDDVVIEFCTVVKWCGLKSDIGLNPIMT